MSYADDVRNYCIENIINPARQKELLDIFIRSGDIHKAMNYKDRLPLVCSALGANKFEEEAKVKRISMNGPTCGANCVFHFRIIY